MINCKRFETRIDGLYEVVRRQDNNQNKYFLWYSLGNLLLFLISGKFHSRLHFTQQPSRQLDIVSYFDLQLMNAA